MQAAIIPCAPLHPWCAFPASRPGAAGSSGCWLVGGCRCGMRCYQGQIAEDVTWLLEHAPYQARLGCHSAGATAQGCPTCGHAACPAQCPSPPAGHLGIHEDRVQAYGAPASRTLPMESHQGQADLGLELHWGGGTSRNGIGTVRAACPVKLRVSTGALASGPASLLEHEGCTTRPGAGHVATGIGPWGST